LSRIAETVTGVKVAGATAAGTMASGFASFVGWIPDDIGKAVSLIGGILSIVMIQYWRKNTKKLELETKILQLEFEAAQREATKKRRVSDARDARKN
jgi:hypothetical protein